MGNFFAGLAALMTVFTAAATSYVAVATYQDQRKQDAEKEEDAAANFAQRVEFVPAVDGTATLDNPNNFALSDVSFKFTGVTNRDNSLIVVTLTSESMVLPACTRVDVGFQRILKLAKEGKGDRVPARYLTASLVNVSAYFEDRTGKGWLSRGYTVFRPGHPWSFDKNPDPP